MDGVSSAWAIVVGLPILFAHMLTIALTKALQSYSRSLLEERCDWAGHPNRAREAEHWAHRTQRAAEALGVLSGLLLAALMGVEVRLEGYASRAGGMLAVVLTIGFLGYVLAGVAGKVFPEIVIDRLWPLAGGLRALALPLTFGLRQIERLMEAAASGRSRAGHRPAHLQVEVPVGDDAEDDEDEPELPESARNALRQAVLLTRTDVGTIMTPRSAIVSLASTVFAAEAAATFRRTGLSRIPIYGESRDDIVGVLYAKDLFARVTNVQTPHGLAPRDLMRPAHFVPETKNAYELLEEMRAERTHFAIVLDEYGGAAGVVSLEDLLEELVGTIDDEHDIPTPADTVRELGDSRYDVDASVTLEELNERLDLELPTDAEYQTVGGLVFHELGRLPAKGDSVNVSGVTFTVREVADHTIRRLLIERASDAAGVQREPSRSSK
jgi:CBS domain containing-hemolysin-like protein